MGVYMCVCICIYIYIYMYIHINILYIYTCIWPYPCSTDVGFSDGWHRTKLKTGVLWYYVAEYPEKRVQHLCIRSSQSARGTICSIINYYGTLKKSYRCTHTHVHTCSHTHTRSERTQHMRHTPSEPCKLKCVRFLSRRSIGARPYVRAYVLYMHMFTCYMFDIRVCALHTHRLHVLFMYIYGVWFSIMVGLKVPMHRNYMNRIGFDRFRNTFGACPLHAKSFIE